MRRVIGIDIHRAFGEVVIWQDGLLRHLGRIDMTRTALEGFGRSLDPGRHRHRHHVRGFGRHQCGDIVPPTLLSQIVPRMPSVVSSRPDSQ